MDRFYRDRHPFRGRTVVADPTRKSSSSWFDFHDNGTRPGLNARRLGAIDRPVASPYSTSEIPDLFVTATIHPRLLNVDPRAQETRLRLCRRDNGLPGFPTSFYTRARIILRTVEYLRVQFDWSIKNLIRPVEFGSVRSWRRYASNRYTGWKTFED